MGDALKSGDMATLSTLRMLWSAIRMEEIDTKENCSDAAVERLVSRTVKQLQDALHDFEKGGRQDLVEKTRAEMALLQTYLPAQLSDEELRVIIERGLTGLPALPTGRQAGQAGVTDKSQMGRAMGAVMKEVGGRADGNRVRTMLASMVK